VPKQKAYEGPFVIAEQKIRARWSDLIDVALELAIEGKSEKMVIYCIDRLIGKPSQPIDLEVRRAADRIGAATGADPEFLIRRAQQLAAQHATEAASS
jgi:hypothetical protein